MIRNGEVFSAGAAVSGGAVINSGAVISGGAGFVVAYAIADSSGAWSGDWSVGPTGSLNSRPCWAMLNSHRAGDGAL